MSRQIRRLQQQQQQAGASKTPLAEDDLEEEEEQTPQRSSKPAFSRLAESSSSSDEDDEEEATPAAKPLPPPQPKASATTTSKKTNKKPVASTTTKPRKQVDNDDDEDMAFLDEQIKNTMVPILLLGKDEGSPKPNRFAFSLDHLNAEEEVKRKLGKALFKSNAQKQKQKKPSSSKRHFLLSTPDADWQAPPAFHAGAGCRMVKQPQTGLYVLEPNAAYLVTQTLYEHAVASYDPNQLMELIQLHPYQIDALLALFDFFQSRQQNEYAITMLRRALYALEVWCGASFCAQFGSVVLAPGGEGINSTLLRALDVSMRLAARRDCFETAFALSLLIQSLVLPSTGGGETFAMLHCDYFAIKSRNLAWSADQHTRRELVNIPSAAFGRAIALFALKRSAEADSALQEAMRNFPKYVECVLLNKVDDEPADRSSMLEPRLSLQAFIRQETLWTPELVSWMRSVSQSLASGTTAQHEEEEIDLDLRRYLVTCKLADLTDKISLLPAEAMAQEQEEDEFFNQVQQEFVQAQQQEERAEPNVDVANGNNVMLFLQTLLPWARLPPQ